MSAAGRQHKVRLQSHKDVHICYTGVSLARVKTPTERPSASCSTAWPRTPSMQVLHYRSTTTSLYLSRVLVDKTLCR